MLKETTVMVAFFAVVLALFSAPPGDVHLIAHRGGVVDEQRPENTLSSLEEAVRQQYWMVEIDVRMSKDGELILSHDNNFGRIYGVHKKVSDLAWDEIRQLRSPVGNQAPPSLREYAARCRGRVPVMMDTEETGTGEFFEKMEQILRENDLLTSAFFIGSAQQKAHFKGKGRVAISRGELEKAVTAGEEVSKLYFLFEHGNTLSEADVKYAQSVAVPVVASVNTYHYMLRRGPSTAETDIQHLRQWGVAYFQIDSVYAPLLAVPPLAGSK
jgi:glycerophosphoryl diester phosphodiesterase